MNEVRRTEEQEDLVHRLRTGIGTRKSTWARRAALQWNTARIPMNSTSRDLSGRDVVVALTICGYMHSGEHETKMTRTAPASLAI